ncbi:MAG: DUF1471 domain-containing protein [Paludibacteraceae bacterium]
MKHKFIITLFLPLVFISCGLVKTVSVSEKFTPTENIEIVPLNQPLPPGLTRIGSITINGSQSVVWSYDDCSYENCMQAIIEEAKKVGADVIYIVSVVAPNQGFISGTGCYTIIADLYIKDKTNHFLQEQ